MARGLHSSFGLRFRGQELVVALRRAFRHLRYGKPIIVVSGLPRSGTSMVMRMLESGGMGIATDGIRQADDDNPRGYYELEGVKALENAPDAPWLATTRGRAVKIIAFLLRYLPERFNYRVVFVSRDLEEVLASQAKMLRHRGEQSGTDDARMRQLFEDHLWRARRLLTQRRCFSVLDVNYNEILLDPEAQAARIQAFVGAPLDVERMAAAVDPSLYRNRR